MISLKIDLLRQSFAAITVSLSMTLTYLNLNWLSPIATRMASQDSPIPMTQMQRSSLATTMSIGAAMANLLFGSAAHRWGRKRVLLIIGPIAIVSYILMSYTRSLNVLYICSFINGITTAFSVSLSPVYIAETVSANVRGTLVSLYLALFHCGGIYVNIAAYFVHNYTWYICTLAVVPIVFTCLIYFLPETPYHLVMRGKEQEAFNSLQWFKPSNTIEMHNNKITNIKSFIRKEFSWKNFLTKRQHRNSLIIASTAQIFKCMGGEIVLSLYATQIFETIVGINSYRIDLILSIILYLIMLLTTLLPNYLSDSYARRPVILITSVIAGLFYIIVALYFYIHNGQLDNYGTIHLWIMVISIILAINFSNAAMSTLLPIVSAECFITEARPLGSAISHTFSNISVAVNAVAYQFFNIYIGQYFNFLLYGCISFCTTALVYFCIRETSRKTLEIIQKEREMEYVE